MSGSMASACWATIWLAINVLNQGTILSSGKAFLIDRLMFT